MSRPNRRQVLQNAGLTLLSSPLWESFLTSVFSKAFAQTAASDKIYLHLTMPGAPPRWLFDLPVKPTATSTFTAGGFGMGIDDTSNPAKAVYDFLNYASGGVTYQLPPVWGMGRAGKPYTNLLDNMTMFRGVDMQINNHGASNGRQTAPILGGLSLGGVLADRAEKPMPSVSDNASGAARAFHSEKGLSSLTLPNATATVTNPMIPLMKAFEQLPANSPIKISSVDAAIKNSQDALSIYGQEIGLRPAGLRDALDQARTMINDNVYALAASFPTVVAKYNTAVEEAYSRARINQLFPKPIKADGSAGFKFDVGKAVTTTDLRTMFVDAATSPNMAARFAAAEILMTNGLTSNLTLNMEAPRGYDLASTASFGVIHDQHNVGAVMSVLSTTAFYRAMLNCIQELVATLTAKSLFNKTVIHIGSEFNRSPRADGSGSDHGFYGASASIISGMISQYALIGNIYANGKDSTNSPYAGTWGRAAPFAVSGNETRPILVQDIALTIGSMLNTTPVSANGYILLNAGDGWKPIRREAKNV